MCILISLWLLRVAALVGGVQWRMKKMIVNPPSMLVERQCVIYWFSARSALCGVCDYNYRKTSDRIPRLVSVQVNQTPACMRGLSGPGLYHSMLCLCYFIHKNVNFHVTGYQYCVYFHTKTSTFSSSILTAEMMSSFAVSPVSLSNTITPQLVCGTWLVTGARLLSVQVNETPACMRGSASIQRFTVDVICATLVLWSISTICP